LEDLLGEWRGFWISRDGFVKRLFVEIGKGLLKELKITEIWWRVFIEMRNGI
jgi:hypothetical protein